MTHLEQAQKYLAQGWSIIPIKQGTKLPAVTSWIDYQKRLPTREEVQNWWTEIPNANIAVVCGEISNIIVVDIDKKNGGTTKSVNLSPTLVSNTGGGGHHYIYKWRKGLVGAKVGIVQGIDIRSDASYIVLPPSLHSYGNLSEWANEGEEIPEAPEWLNSNEQIYMKTDWDKILNDKTSTGLRNMTSAQVAGKLISETKPELWNTIGVGYFRTWNKQNNVPPLPEKELIVTWNSIMKTHLKKNPLTLTDDNDEIVFLKSSDIKSKPIDWLWNNKIAKGKVTMIAGDPGLGKSQITIFLAGVVSNGGIFPCGSKCKQGSVLFFSAEDDPEDTINPRLMAVGANLEKIRIFSIVNRKGKEKFFDLSKDMDLLEKALSKDKEISFIIVDPITAFLGDTDSHVNAEVRALLSQLSKLASKYSIAILVVTHLNKSTGGNAMSKITGSLAFVAAARAAFMVIKDENDEERRLFLTVKNNIANDKGGFAFRVEGVEMEGEIKTSRVIWEKEPISMSVTEALRSQKENGDGVDKQTVAWLEEYLRKYPDGVPFDMLQKEALRQGISKSTLYRAEKNVFVDKIYQGKGKAKLWKIVFDEGNETEELAEEIAKKL